MSNSHSRSTADESLAGAASHGVSGSDAHQVHAADTDNTGSRMNRIDQDTGTDERAQLETLDRSGIIFGNLKRTADMAQTMDLDAILESRNVNRRSESYENRAAEATLLHQSKVNSLEIAERQQDHAQRVRFADANSTVQVALLGDMAEKLGEVHAMICRKA